MKQGDLGLMPFRVEDRSISFQNKVKPSSNKMYVYHAQQITV